MENLGSCLLMDIKYLEHQRVSTAKLAEGVLNDFFNDSNSLKKAREKHKKRERLGVRRNIQQLESLSVGSTLVSKSIDLSSSTSANDLTSPIRTNNLQNPVFLRHSVNDLIHRVTAISGGSPGHTNTNASTLTTSSNILDDLEEIDVGLLTEAGEIQFSHLQESDNAKATITRFLELHGQIDDLVVKELHFRKELGEKVDSANKEFVSLFENMLSEVLVLQRLKFKTQTKKNQLLKDMVLKANERILAAKDALEKANAKNAQLTEKVLSIREKTQGYEAEIKLCNERLEYLENIRISYEKMQESSKESLSLFEKRKAEFMREVREEERMKHLQAMHDLRSRLMKQLKQEYEAQLKAAGANQAKGVTVVDPAEEFNKLAALAQNAQDFTRPKANASIQTEVDELGLWDKKDGWILPITGTLLARQRWRRACEFAKCPQCRGIGKFVGYVAILLKQMQRGQPPTEDQKNLKKGLKWSVPDELTRFMSNLPKSVQAINPKGVLWSFKVIWTLVEEKGLADESDNALGYAIQTAPEFLIEAFLQRGESRVEAEIEMYKLIVSMKELYKKHPLLQTFARFLQCLDGLSEFDRQQAELDRKKEKAIIAKKQLDDHLSLNARERSRIESENKEKAEIKKKQLKQYGKNNEDEKHYKITDRALSLGVLSVYLYARRCLMHQPYKGIYAARIDFMKKTFEELKSFQSKVEGDVDWKVTIPTHICVSDTYECWVPLDRGLRVLHVLTSFLTEEEKQKILHSLEYNTKLMNGYGKLVEPQGEHSNIRLLFRRLLNSSSEDGHDLTWEEIFDSNTAGGRKISSEERSAFIKSETTMPIRQTLGSKKEEDEKEREQSKSFGENVIFFLNLDHLLQLLIEALLFRSEYIEKTLGKIFIDGDSNGDGVLSFREFTDIVSKVAPHFHERRILKMFREALMSGNDDETIGPTAFVDVCKKHGLVQLVDIHAYREGELRALSHHLHIIDDDETFKISTGTQTDATLPVIDKNKSKSALSKSVKAVTALRMTSKMSKFMSAKTNIDTEAFQDHNSSTSISTINQYSKIDNNNRNITELGSFNDDDDGSVNTNASSINSDTNTNTSENSFQRVMASFQSSKAILQSNVMRNESQTDYTASSTTISTTSTNRSKLDIFLPANIAAANHREDISIPNNNYSNMDNNNMNSFQNSIPMRNTTNNKVNFSGLVNKVRNDDISTNSMVIRHPISDANTNTHNDITNRSNHYVTTASNVVPIKSEVSHLKLPKNENISKILKDDIAYKLKLRKMMRKQEGFNDDDSF